MTKRPVTQIDLKQLRASFSEDKARAIMGSFWVGFIFGMIVAGFIVLVSSHDFS